MTRFSGCYLAHNLTLIAFDKYWKRQLSLRHYCDYLDVLLAYGRTAEGWTRTESMI